MGTARQICRWLAFGVYTISASVLFLEALVRLFIPQILPWDTPDLWQPDERIGYRHQPNARLWTNTGDRRVQICFDAVGDRIDCEQAKEQTCDRRILVIGDSYVEALAIPWAETVWNRIEEDLGACMFVAGVGGYGIPHYLRLTRDRLNTGTESFDLVILALYVGNDFTSDPEAIPSAQEVQRKPLRLLPAGVSARDIWLWFYPINSFLESRSHAYVAGRYAIRRFKDPGDVGIYGVPLALRPSKLTEINLRETKHGVKLIAQEVKRAGGKFLLVLIPHRSQVLDADAETITKALPWLNGDVDMNYVSTAFLPEDSRHSGDRRICRPVTDFSRKGGPITLGNPGRTLFSTWTRPVV